MFKTCKSLKISAISIIAILIIAYVGLWFYAANNIKKAFDLYSHKEGSNFSYSKLSIQGFPFNIKAKIDDLKFGYNLTKANVNMAIACDEVIVTTNILFNKIKFTLPSRINYNVTYAGETYDFYDLSQGSYYLELRDQNLINIHKVIASIAKEKTYTDFSFAKLHYHADGLRTIDQKTGQEIFNSHADLNITLDSKKDSLSDLSVRIDSEVEMTNQQNLVPSFMNFIFHKTSINANVDASFKRNDGTFEIPLLNVNNLEVDLDSTQINLAGDIKQNDETGQPIVNLKLKLTEWDVFFKTLIGQQIISTNQYNLITYLIQDISGQQSSPQNSFEVEIKSEKDGAIKVGNIDLSAVSYYLQQIALSE